MDNITISAQNDFELSNEASFVAWLKRCMSLLQVQIGEIHISLMSDESLLEINTSIAMLSCGLFTFYFRTNSARESTLSLNKFNLTSDWLNHHLSSQEGTGKF